MSTAAPRVFGPRPTLTLEPVWFTEPATLDLHAYRGDSGRFRVNVTDSTGAPLDVTAATWDADIRLTPDTATPILSLTVTPVAGDQAAVDVVLSATDSALLPAAAVWDLQMTLAGEVTTLLAGKVSTTFDVSRTP